MKTSSDFSLLHVIFILRLLPILILLSVIHRSFGAPTFIQPMETQCSMVLVLALVRSLEKKRQGGSCVKMGDCQKQPQSTQFTLGVYMREASLTV